MSSTGSRFEWYLVSISKLKLIAGLILALLVAAGVWYFQTEIAGSPSRLAQRAIQDAERSLNEMAGLDNLQEYRRDFQRADLLLTDAKDSFSEESFAEAEQFAVESQTLSRSVLSRVQGETRAAAQFLTVEGNVEYQRAGGAFRKAVPRTTLQKGDWVRTGQSSSAELFFANGSLYTVGPDALLEIYPAKSRRSNRPGTVKMEVGKIEVNTADDRSTVSTPAAEITVESTSTTLVDVEETGATDVAAVRGSSSIVAEEGPAVSLAEGERVSASDEGEISEVEAYASPPVLGAPADNTVISASRGRIITLEWREVPRARAYRLQVSRSRLFGHLEIDATRSGTKARVRLTSSGSFYWRVATVGEDRVVGPYSPAKRFRVTGIGDTSSPLSGDTEPPSLEITEVNHLGGPSYQIVGVAEPGASVFINDEAIRVDSSGSFRHLITFNRIGYNTVVIKAVDPAGNPTIRRERVNVQE